MKTVFVTIEAPSTKKGAPVRIYNLIKQAVLQGVAVDLVTIADEGFDAEALKRELGIGEIITVPQVRLSLVQQVWQILTRRIPPYFAEYRASRLAEALLEYAERTRPDVVQFEILHSMDATAGVIDRLKGLGAKIVLDAHNVEYTAFILGTRTFSLPKRLLGEYVAPHLLQLEKDAARRADHIFTCSDEDKNFFDAVTTPERVSVVPNGVDCAVFYPMPLVSEHSLIFTGSMQYPPNEDGLRFFFDSVYPLVKERVPDVSISILGGEPALWLKTRMLSDTSINAPGLVPDVREYLARARVCISPVRSGSGTSLKLLEYMGSAKPIVSTTVGARGIACTDGEDILIADTTLPFASAVVKLLTDDELAGRIATRARETATQQYDWKNICGRMIEGYHTTVARVSTAAQRLVAPGESSPSYWLGNVLALAAFNVGIVLHLPVISDIIGFLFLFGMPGFLITHLIAPKRSHVWHSIVHIVGLSISFVIVGGLLANTIYPLFGVAHPLALYPMLYAYDVLLLALMVVGLFRGSKPKMTLVSSPISFRVLARHAALVIFPLMALVGATILNNGGSNTVVSVLIVSVVVYVLALLILKKEVSEELFMSSLYFIGLALLFMTSMRGWHIVGYDIHQEFEVFQLTKNALLWSMAHLQDPYNACLSITLLPTVISQFVHIPDEYIFKFISQIVFALMPVTVYMLVRNFGDKKTAFLASFFFMGQIWFFQGMPTLIRQEFASLFFGLVLLTMFDTTIRRSTKYTLALVYTLSMVLSHYSTSYIALGLFAVVYVGNMILHVLHRYEYGAMHKRHITYHVPSYYLIGFIAILVLWNGAITHTGNNLSSFFDDSSSHFSSIFSVDTLSSAAEKVVFPPATHFDFATYAKQETLTFRAAWPTLGYYDQGIDAEDLHLLNFQEVPPSFGVAGYDISGLIFRILKIVVNNMFIIVGLVALIYGWYQSKIKDSEFLLLLGAGFLLLAFLLLVPGALKEYNLERLYFQLLIVWSFASVYGGILLMRMVGGDRLKYVLLGGVYCLLFLFYSGLIFSFAGGPALFAMNNYGEDYEKFYTLETDVAATKWLSVNYDEGAVVYTSSTGRNNLEAYGTVDLTKVVLGTLPGTYSKGSYVLLTHMNVIGGAALCEPGNNVYSYNFPFSFLSQHKNKIYSNGAAEIYL